MFTTRPPHGYSPQLLSELGTAELFVLSRPHLANAGGVERLSPIRVRVLPVTVRQEPKSQ
ncbi:MAG: hypothetical protein QOI59_1032 [Gammaproteobacteria bacterium]|jgi:hypothetical protein|nr:hypothetical protein [Gammaproteobacteria bacterium]